MDNLGNILYAFLIIGGLIYIVFLRPKFEQMRNNLIFDNRVIAFVESLSVHDLNLGCSVSELVRYTKNQLEKAHRLPGNQSLIQHTTPQGWHYESWTGPNDYALFAVLCLTQYAKTYNNDKLLAWCESMMEPARRNGLLKF